jgi:hypothetical protein
LVTKFRILLLAIGLLVQPVTATAAGAYADDNPFVEAMLRMMELFGFIDRDRLPLGVPYLPATGYGSFPGGNAMGGIGGLGGNPVTGFGGMPGLGGMPGGYPLGGIGGMPGFAGNPVTGLGAVPGMAAGYPMPGLGGVPGLGGMGGVPGLGGIGGMPGLGGMGGLPGNPWQGGMPFGGPAQGGWAPDGRGNQPPAKIGLLDGIWETNKGAVVIIKADAARLYVAQDRYQDFIIRYDHDHFWWQPRDGSKFRRYRYEMREGRMILADKDNNLLLLRRRR